MFFFFQSDHKWDGYKMEDILSRPHANSSANYPSQTGTWPAKSWRKKKRKEKG